MRRRCSPTAGSSSRALWQSRLVDVDFAVARLQPGGALDPTFSADGRTTVGFGGSRFRVRRGAAARWPDRARRAEPARGDDIAVARLEGVTPPPAGGAGAGTARRRSCRGSRRRRVASARGAGHHADARAQRAGDACASTCSRSARVAASARAAASRRAPIASAGAARCASREGGFSRSLAAGRSTLAFSGRVGKRALPPARYTLRATPTDAAGNTRQPAGDRAPDRAPVTCRSPAASRRLSWRPRSALVRSPPPTRRRTTCSSSTGRAGRPERPATTALSARRSRRRPLRRLRVAGRQPEQTRTTTESQTSSCATCGRGAPSLVSRGQGSDRATATPTLPRSPPTGASSPSSRAPTT